MNDPRIVYRLVPYTVWHAPEGATVHDMSCMTPYCDATSGPQYSQSAAHDWAARHTGRTGHRLYRRLIADHVRIFPGSPGSTGGRTLSV